MRSLEKLTWDQQWQGGGENLPEENSREGHVVGRNYPGGLKVLDGETEGRHDGLELRQWGLHCYHQAEHGYCQVGGNDQT